RFAQSIPTLVAADFRNILDSFLKKNDLKLKDFEAFACHPGGAKVLDALEDALEIQRGDLADSRSVLQDFGNMSAVTVMFVLERMKKALPTQKTLATALGPGFSCAFLAFEPA
ncbi:MAG TPA: 3-oxoacyl-[acyl-carrier-protein] synthase III C-terminal domain-containing protein, partial [Rhizomicrobium sp.]|nr:3-oxoacyl-[acyl-carrier-protein] synthase III C-terminal domain-containing protein [Rhizomicrobium sp.]